MKLIGFTCTYNEEDMIPYVMPYVERMGYDKFIVYDNESTDNTVELLKRYPFVEVRTYKTNGVFNEDIRVSLAYTVYGEAYNLARVGREDEELVWLTVTDFDEVLFISSTENVRDFLESSYYTYSYNYYNNMMVNLLPPMDSDGENLLKRKYVHLSDGIRGNYWTTSGYKTTIFAVNDVNYYGASQGFHSIYVGLNKDRVLRSFSETGKVFGFHLKYINKNRVELRHTDYRTRSEHYQEKTDFVYDSLYTASFPLEYYFALIPIINETKPFDNHGCFVYHGEIFE